MIGRPSKLPRVPLRVLQTSTGPARTTADPISSDAPAPPFLAFDGSRPAPQFKVLRAAFDSGHDAGLRKGFKQGVRWGLLCGASSLFAAGVLIAAIVAGLGARA